MSSVLTTDHLYKYVILIVDSTKEIKQYHRGDSLKKCRQIIKTLPQNGWKFLSLMRWDRDHWTTLTSN